MPVDGVPPTCCHRHRDARRCGTARRRRRRWSTPSRSTGRRRCGRRRRRRSTQKDKAFTPRVLAVPVGSTVRFPNDDAIFHNVFSLSAGNAVRPRALSRRRRRRAARSPRRACVRVFCNIHPQMTAFVVVVPTPWVTMADADGAFRLDLPPGRYRLTALSERAARGHGRGDGRGHAAPALDRAESAFTPRRIAIRAAVAHSQQVRAGLSEAERPVSSQIRGTPGSMQLAPTSHAEGVHRLAEALDRQAAAPARRPPGRARPSKVASLISISPRPGHAAQPRRQIHRGADRRCSRGDRRCRCCRRSLRR